MCLRTIERFKKMNTLEFKGGPNLGITNTWHDDTHNICVLMDMDPVETRRLAVTCLMGGVVNGERCQYFKGRSYFDMG